MDESQVDLKEQAPAMYVSPIRGGCDIVANELADCREAKREQLEDQHQVGHRGGDSSDCTRQGRHHDRTLVMITQPRDERHSLIVVRTA